MTFYISANNLVDPGSYPENNIIIITKHLISRPKTFKMDSENKFNPSHQKRRI